MRHEISSEGEILYGRQPVLEALRAGRRHIRELLIRPSVRATAELADVLDLAAKRGVRIANAEPSVLDQLTAGGHHQGLALRAAAYPYVPFNDLLGSLGGAKRPPLILLADHIEDPQNLGSLLRSGDAAGVDGVIVPDRRAAAVTPAVVRASAGAAEHVRVSLVTNLVRSMQALKEHELWIAGLEGVPDAKVYTEADLTGPLGLVVGSEGHGLGRLVGETCDFLIRIPLYGRVGSLNAGVAGGIALFEIQRQRAAPGRVRS